MAVARGKPFERPKSTYLALSSCSQTSLHTKVYWQRLVGNMSILASSWSGGWLFRYPVLRKMIYPGIRWPLASYGVAYWNVRRDFAVFMPCSLQFHDIQRSWATLTLLLDSDCPTFPGLALGDLFHDELSGLNKLGSLTVPIPQ